MKSFILFFLFLFIGAVALSQRPEKTNLSNIGEPISQKRIGVVSNQLVDNYKTAIRNAGDCKRGFDAAQYCKDNMTDDATIEVINARTKRRRTYPAAKYFTVLKAIFCSESKIYDEVKYSFTDFPLHDTSIVRDLYNHYLVKCRIGQTFRGSTNDVNIYSDYTIKVIHIDFSPYRKGAFEARIIKIEVESVNLLKNEPAQ